jgi:sugar phosphate isomerase/epimerase
VKVSLTTVALPHLSLEETVEFAARLGYAGIELRVRYIRPAEVGQPYTIQGNHKNDLNPANFVALAPRVKQLCDDHGLLIPALACRTTASELDDVRRLAEGAAICGCPLVRIGAPRRYDGSVGRAALSLILPAGEGIGPTITCHRWGDACGSRRRER